MVIRNGQDRNGQDNMETLELQVYGLGGGEKNHEEQKQDAQCLPAQKMPALVRETRKQAGDYGFRGPEHKEEERAEFLTH